MTREFILTMKCPDQPGLVGRVASLLASAGCDIRDAAVHGDSQTGSFFIRKRLRSAELDRDGLLATLSPLADTLATDWALHDLDTPMRIAIAVSRFDHCLLDLLHKWRIGSLPVEVVAILSNHETAGPIAARYDVPFHYLPITPETKATQEAAITALLEETQTELFVLARYMQILSDDMTRSLAGRCINIHHSFLPSFKGARPYHQAHARGVKLIGATAHYVTADLDEGPIIEQDVRRVTHATSPEDMVAIGREVEASVLSRAVRWHAEHRVFLNEARTVVLS